MAAVKQLWMSSLKTDGGWTEVAGPASREARGALAGRQSQCSFTEI